MSKQTKNNISGDITQDNMPKRRAAAQVKRAEQLEGKDQFIWVIWEVAQTFFFI